MYRLSLELTCPYMYHILDHRFIIQTFVDVMRGVGVDTNWLIVSFSD